MQKERPTLQGRGFIDENGGGACGYEKHQKKC
jgi:hypothetical protein